MDPRQHIYKCVDPIVVEKISSDQYPNKIKSSVIVFIKFNTTESNTAESNITNGNTVKHNIAKYQVEIDINIKQDNP